MEGGREREGGGGGGEALLTIKKRVKVGKHNALSGNTASARTGPAYDGEYYTPTLCLASWHAFVDTRGLEMNLFVPITQRLPRGVETARPVGRASGSQTDLERKRELDQMHTGVSIDRLPRALHLCSL